MAMIPSNYSINISRAVRAYYGQPYQKHWGRVELGFSITRTEAEAAFAEACNRFPAEEGWELTLDYASCRGTELERRKGAAQ